MIKKIFDFIVNTFRLIFILVISVSILLNMIEASHESDATNDLIHSYPPAVDALISITTQLENQQHDAALFEIESLLVQLPLTEKKLHSWLHQQAAMIHQDRLHYHYAIASYKKAEGFNPDVSHSMAISSLQKAIDRQQSERHLNTAYNDARYSGIAHRMHDKVVIAYIYLSDNKYSQWTNKTKLENRLNLQRVTSWYQQQAEQYGVSDITFETRFFIVDSPKGLIKGWLREEESFDYIKNLLLTQLGHKDLNSFVNTLKQQSDAEQVAIVFHSNSDGRSFASHCLNAKNNRCHIEYAMLTEKMKKAAYSWFVPQTQSHEILHLFGADDLYSIKSAKDYAVTDIMNYYSSDLKYATIDPITAWSIGWANKPETPFEITRY